MSYVSADARKIRRIVDAEILTESKQGPKRSADKLVEILVLLSRNTRDHEPPLTRKEIVARTPDIKENVLEDYLKFLCETPSERPFLNRTKRNANPHKRGPQPYEYTFNLWYLLNRSTKKLEASIVLAWIAEIRLRHEETHYKRHYHWKTSRSEFLQGHVSRLSQLALPQMTEEERQERKKSWWHWQ